MNRQQLIAAGLVAVSSIAGAQSLKPGLWEVSQSGGGEMTQALAAMQKDIANMPPDQAKMMRDMMARQGVHMAEGGGMAVKTCMTKEMAQRNQLPQQRDDCKTTVQGRSGKTVKMSFSCTNPPATGEGQVTFSSPEAYSTKMTVNAKVDGQAQTMNMESSGKWLAADCGDIKPLK